MNGSEVRCVKRIAVRSHDVQVVSALRHVGPGHVGTGGICSPIGKDPEVNGRQSVGARAFLDFTNKRRPGPCGWVSNDKVNQSVLLQCDSLDKQVTGSGIDSERSEICDRVRADVALSVQ